MKDLQLYAQVVFHNQNLVTLRCCFVEGVTELFQSSSCTCSTLICPHSTNQILNLWRCRCLSLVDAKATFIRRRHSVGAFWVQNEE